MLVERVTVGNMLPGGVPFNDCNVNPTWRAHVQTSDGVKVAFVKLIEPRSLYIECVCAVIGRSLGLPIPAPLIVRVTSTALSDIPHGEARLAFGSEDAKYPSFRRYINSDSKEAMDKLAAFSKTLDVGIFDEWVANWDRNIGNMLYDGKDDFYFIDHENAIPQGLAYNVPARGNEILRCLYSHLSEFEKHKLSKEVGSTFIPNFRSLPFALLSEKTMASHYLGDDEIADVVCFLTERLNCINALFDNRVNIKQQGMAI
ncbi:hypothetical protein BCT65_020985 [Vibrio splendidus]|uniref:HipA family kinase n=1 Tax=Vibrio splendidus TaxID=29497 RepID=UPI000C84D0F5|nr:HipA family kinase [Vibrio splendidus]MCC5519513.1 hypothetical protein [Vibrio splendidus]